MSVQPLQFLLLVFAGWVNRKQLEVIDYLKEENRVLREQLDGPGLGSPMTSADGLPPTVRCLGGVDSERSSSPCRGRVRRALPSGAQPSRAG